MRNKIRGIQGFHHGPSKDDPKSLNQHRSEEDLDKKLTADYATQSERGMSDAEYSKHFSEGSIHNSNLPEVDLGTVPNNNKDSNGEKSTYSKVLDGVNTSLTVGGMVPAIGAVADAGNFLFSGARTLANAVSDTASGFSTGNFNYDKRLADAYDYCNNESLGFLSFLKKKYKNMDNIEIRTAFISPNPQWFFKDYIQK